MSAPGSDQKSSRVSWWQPVLFAALAGGMGWGIRGQYGHESGAMIAGVLVSLTLVFLLCPGLSTLQAVRAVALGTIAMGFGGSMTYGQTVGLTNDAPLIGNWEALRWGMLGLAIKGGVWIGFAGFFLGLGMGGKRYRPLEMLLFVLALLAAVFLGWWLLNSPHDPENQRLPTFYFSDHWRWEPGVELKHRPEIWGGLVVALTSAMLYAIMVKKDALARNMALWGILGGALGFPIGQGLQAFNAWNPNYFSQSFLAPLTNYFNWWNMMETTFGAIMGALLGFGLWLNRNRINISAVPQDRPMPFWLEGILLALHIYLLTSQTFFSNAWFERLYDFGIMMALIPLVACVRGRFWAYLQILPITLLPIAGKTLRQLAYREDDPINLSLGWLIYLILPLLVATAFAGICAARNNRGASQPTFIRNALLFNTWMFFGLNYAFFHFPWPWTQWTGRTPNGILFTICALGLTAMVILNRRREVKQPR